MTLLGVVDNLLEQNNIDYNSNTTTKKKDSSPSLSSPSTPSSKQSNGNDATNHGPAEIILNSKTTTTTTTAQVENGKKQLATQRRSRSSHYEYDQRYSMLVKQDKDQAMVATPFGPGLVIRTRRNPQTLEIVSRDVELTDWKTAVPKKGPPRPAMLYTATEYPSVPPEIGNDVMTLFGRGRVVDIRNNSTNSNHHQKEPAAAAAATTTTAVQQQQQDNDKTIMEPCTMLVVQLTSWRLAGRSRVTCHLRPHQVQVVRPKQVYEMNVFERVERAHKLKDEARQAFSRKQYERALSKYSLAVDAVRYVQHQADSTNEVRADLLVVMITCCNNAATCAAANAASPIHNHDNKQQWNLVSKFASNALLLIQALEDRQTGGKTSNICKVLRKDGYDAVKIFGEWKGKSLLFLAKAHAEQQNYDKATEECKKIHDVVTRFLAEDPTNKVLLQHDKEMKRIHTVCKERKKLQLKKEKQRAQAMFGGGGGNNSGGPKSDNNDNNEEEEEKISRTSSAVKTAAASGNGDAKNPTEDCSRKSVHFEDGGKPHEPYNKKAKAATEVDDDRDDDDDDDYDVDEVELPWYKEHQELLILASGLAVGAGLTQLLWKRNRSSG